MNELRIINGLVYQDSRFVKTNLYINNGIITNISDDLHEALETYDCHGNLVLPGIIDPHTHFELDLGWITSKDDFYHGSIAAAFGGVTTFIDFLEPVSNHHDLKTAFRHRQQQAQASVVDYKFHACLKNPHDIPQITKTMKSLHLNTVKIFTTYSDSNRRTYDEEIKALLQQSKIEGFTVTAHIENDDLIDLDPTATFPELPDRRPTESETSEALKLAGYVDDIGGTLYMVHCSSGKTLEALKYHYPHLLNTRFIIESCPHYFRFNRTVLDGENGYLYTMAPPLRSPEEQDLLNKHIDDVYTIGTDHCSFDRKDKDKKLLKDIPLGVGGVEESFPVLYTMFGDQIIDKMTKNVALAHHLFPQKGILQVGSDADVFVYQQQPTTVQHHSLSDYSLYRWIPVNGQVITTISRGRFVVRDGALIPHTGTCLNQ